MNKLQTKKQINGLALLFMITYMVSYITRINYGAIILEMERDTQISKGLLAMAVTGSFVTYGIGQTISGVLGDRFSPKKLVLYGLITTVIMNVLIPVCQNPWQMTVVWCINGFTQSLMWPPMVRIMTYCLSNEDYKKTCVKVSWGSSFGTIAVYLLSPLIISAWNWKAVFWFSAVCGLVMCFVWNKYSYDAKTENKEKAEKASVKPLFTPVMICIMLTIILQGMLRDGVTTWMPSYIAETYNLGNTISILSGVVLPVFSIICFQVTEEVYRKKLKNPLTCAGVIFFAGAVGSVLLFMVTGKSAGVSVLLSAVITGCMHGVNLMLICMIPPFFEKYGNVSTASGVLNSCTYIGSALSTYGIAVLSENFGWSFTIFMWIVIALLGTALCLICARPWKKRME